MQEYRSFDFLSPWEGMDTAIPGDEKAGDPEQQGRRAMKPSLKPGLKHRFAYTVPETKTVPHLYRESPELQAMPEVFATGFMVGLMEWTCVQLLEPHLDPGEGSLGTHIDVAHKSATPPASPSPSRPNVSRCGARARASRSSPMTASTRSALAPMSASSSPGTGSTAASQPSSPRLTPRGRRGGRITQCRSLRSLPAASHSLGAADWELIRRLGSRREAWDDPFYWQLGLSVACAAASGSAGVARAAVAMGRLAHGRPGRVVLDPGPRPRRHS